MKSHLEKKKLRVVDRFGLQGLESPVDLYALAKKWGVSSIIEQPISSDAMLVPGKDGYSVILKPLDGPGGRARQRFSFAHELGHLLLRTMGLSDSSDVAASHRLPSHIQGDEEKLCDQIAAEILFPALSFEEDAWMNGWTLKSVKSLAEQYQTSVTATAIRMVELMPEPCVIAAWKPRGKRDGRPSLQWSHSKEYRYAVSRDISEPDEFLIKRALDSDQVVTGEATIIDTKSRLSGRQTVCAESLAWGRDNRKQAMVYYYPRRRFPGV